MNFKKLTAIVLMTSMLAACGKPIVHDGKEYPTYGFFNEATKKSNEMCYELSIGNTVWSILLVKSVVFPVYFIGFSLFNPIGPKTEKGCGIDAA